MLMNRFEIILSLTGLVSADLSFRCTRLEDVSMRGYGDVSLYESCGTDIC